MIAGPRAKRERAFRAGSGQGLPSTAGVGSLEMLESGGPAVAYEPDPGSGPGRPPTAGVGSFRKTL